MVNFQPCTSAQTNLTPALTLAPDLTLTLTLRGARDRRGQSGGVLPQKPRAAKRPTSTSKTRTMHKLFLPTRPPHRASLPNACIFSPGDSVRIRGTEVQRDLVFFRLGKFLKILPRPLLISGGHDNFTGTRVLELAEYPGYG